MFFGCNTGNENFTVERIPTENVRNLPTTECDEIVTRIQRNSFDVSGFIIRERFPIRKNEDAAGNFVSDKKT